MAQCSIPLPLETTLKLEIARLTHELALAQTRLMQQGADQHHVTTVLTLLHQAGIPVAVPLTAVTFDAEQSCLRYDDQAPGSEGLLNGTPTSAGETLNRVCVE